MGSFSPPRLIETEHLWLRALVDSDAEQVFHALFGDPQVTEWLPMRTLESVDDARTYIRKLHRGWERGTLFTWGLEDKKTGHLCALIELRPNLPRIELGVVTSQRPTHRRRRAGLVALRKLVDWVMIQPGVYRLYACCSPQGHSAPVMEKLGFVLEGRLVNWDARPNLGMQVDDSLIFALTRQPEAQAAKASQDTAPAPAHTPPQITRHDVALQACAELVD
jgi:[ribosomal protein S5]-alanine N-acetyltransferase